MKEQIKKRKSFAFGKNVYLLGEDSNGIKYWLEEPKWECDWYWGFGYVETYLNNDNPTKSKDISSHQHIKTSFLGKQGKDYIHNLFDSPLLHKITFSKKEGWILSELFEEFYLLQKMAEYCHAKPKPSCNISSSVVDNSMHIIGWYNTINKNMIPTITAKIIELLSPND